MSSDNVEDVAEKLNWGFWYSVTVGASVAVLSELEGPRMPRTRVRVRAHEAQDKSWVDQL